MLYFLVKTLNRDFYKMRNLKSELQTYKNPHNNEETYVK